MATSRLRQTFKYPSDSDLDLDTALDEEHQETLITSLRDEDAAKSALYRRIFLLIPLLAILFYLYTFTQASTARERLESLLSITTLASTAYILHYQPAEAPDRKGKMAVWRVEAGKGPVEKYLAVLTAGLAGLLGVAAVLSWRKGGTGKEDAWREALPGMVFGIAMVARRLLAPLDLEELQRAKYDYKGA